MAEYRAQFPSAYESVGKARRAVVAFARQWFSGDDLSDIESAVGEALANCAEHGYVNGTNIDVRCRFDGREFTVEIKDAGKGFDRWNASDYVKPLSTAPRGFGTFIMRQLMDEMEYTDHGTQVALGQAVFGGGGRGRRDRRAFRLTPTSGWSFSGARQPGENRRAGRCCRGC